MLTLTDHDLALHARRGNPQAYGELVRRYQTSVFNVCYRLVGERREAEDLAQEAFIHAYQRLDRYDVERPFGPWIRRIAANLCINALEVNRAMDMPLEDELDSPDWVGTYASETGSPERLRLQVESAEAVRQAIAGLPPVYRAVIELRHFQDLSYAEISAELDLPVRDIKSHLYRARNVLAEKLQIVGLFTKPVEEPKLVEPIPLES
jgi:RNA polymerase sigma-70 factor, ECF subfamily